ncbi:hypothetical protein, partial [Paenibacillus sp. y28]|uniref:hypothetical protein n=1 Tax=Paenibacillus sp. y28 TaxID=3129110 RepID=UPI0030197F73
KTLQLGGTSYDPTNYSFKNGRYATTMTQKDGSIYLYWSNEVTYQSASFLRVFVSVYADGRWTAQAVQAINIEKKKGVYYKLAYAGNQIFLRDDVGIRVIPVSDYGNSRPDKHILISPTSSSNELFSVAYYGAKAGVLFGTPDLLGMYFDEDTVIGVQDRHRVLSGQKGNQYVYNPDTKRLNIYNGSAIRQLDVKNGELIYDEQGKDFIIKPVKGSLLSAPAYHSGKMIYVYQTGKRARVAVVDATSLQLESDEFTNYYVDSNYKGLTLLPTSDELRLVGLSEYERRPVLKAVVIKNTSK